MIAGFFISGLTHGAAHRGLETVLSRADQGNVVLPSESEQALLSTMGLADAAVGPCRAMAMNAPVTGRHFLCADPIQLILNRNLLILDDPGNVQLTASEATQLLSEINSHFSTDGIVLEQLSRHRWILSVPDAPDIVALSPYELTGKNIMEHLPQGDNAISWHAWLTEVQSLLHLSSVNQQREERGLAAVNSLWLWGSGNPLENNELTWDHIYTDDPLVSGLASVSGSSTADLDTVDWSKVKGVDKVLVVLTPEAVQRQVGNIESVEHYFNLIHDLWLEPALDAVRKRQLSEIVIYTESCAPFTLSRYSLLRWWRRRKPLSYYRANSL